MTLLGDQIDIWLIDLERDGLATRFTFDDAKEITPVWSPDASQLAFGSLPPNTDTNILQKAATGAGSAESLLTLKFTNYLTSWSPDRRFVLYTEMASEETSGAAARWRAQAIPVRGRLVSAAVGTILARWPVGRVPVRTAARFMAPFSVQAGAALGKWQVSANGGTQPRWSRTGRTLLPDAATRECPDGRDGQWTRRRVRGRRRQTAVRCPAWRHALFIPGLTRRQAVPLQPGTRACGDPGARHRRDQLGRGTEQVVDLFKGLKRGWSKDPALKTYPAQRLGP